jgi:DNA replication protein DnaC
LERGLILVGGHGVGKTHLVVGIALELVQRFREDILFVDFPSLSGLRRSLGRPVEAAESGILRPRDVSLLILDNMGVESTSATQYQTALQIIQARMRAKRPTLCTSYSAKETGASSGGSGKPAGARHGGPSAELCQMHALLFGGFKILRMTGESYMRNKPDSFSLF